MSTEEAQIKEGNVRDDIEEFLSLYSEIGQYGQNQLNKYTEELKKFSKTYRVTHTQLKRLYNQDDYNKLYGHYDNLLEKIRSWFKAAATRETELTADLLRRVEMKEERKEREEQRKFEEEKAEKAQRRKEKERKEREEKEEKERKEREEKDKARRQRQKEKDKARRREEKARKLEEKEKKEAEEKAKEKEERVMIEAKHFNNKVEPELTNLVDDAEDLEEIAESIKGLVRLKEKQNEMQIKCQLVLENAYEDQLKDMFNDSESKIVECIRTQKKKMKFLKQEAITKENELKQKLAMEKEKLAIENEAREKSVHEKSLKDRPGLTCI